MSEWISVKERLPECEMYVLVYVPIGGYGEKRTAYKDVVCEAYSYGEDGLVDVEHGDEHLYGVTHWMPLPEPPKEEGENQ